MPAKHSSAESAAHENHAGASAGHYGSARRLPGKSPGDKKHAGAGSNHSMPRQGRSENSIIVWSGVVILSGILLILLQLSLEAFYLYRHDIRQLGSSTYIGLGSRDWRHINGGDLDREPMATWRCSLRARMCAVRAGCVDRYVLAG
jgi:hypothetical protein